MLEGRIARKIIGLVGPPGRVKSTVGLALREIFSDIRRSPMDGFHLANVELARSGVRTGRAPDTFDSAGYVDLLAPAFASGRRNHLRA